MKPPVSPLALIRPEVRAISAYAVPSVDVAGRFRFKPVVVGQGAEVKHVSLYVYVETERQPLLIQ